MATEAIGSFYLMKCGTVLSIIAVLLAYWYRAPGQDVHLDGRLDAVLSSLLRAERKVGIGSFARPRVAVGFGGCVDIVVDGVLLLDKAGVLPSDQPLHHDFIENGEQLAQSFAYFFPPGAASERFVVNSTLFSKLVEASRRVPGNRWSVGGNALVMAGRMAIEGCDVLLGVSANPDLADVLSGHVTVAGNTVEEPDIHLVLEYPSGAKWGQYTSRRANRYIIHSDKHNPYLASMGDFEQKIRDFQPGLLIIGGLQMMDSFPFKKDLLKLALEPTDQDVTNSCH